MSYPFYPPVRLLLIAQQPEHWREALMAAQTAAQTAEQFRVIIATSTTQALKQYLHEAVYPRPDAILLEATLAGAQRVCEVTRALPNGTHIPLLILAEAGSPHTTALLNAGADDYAQTVDDVVRRLRLLLRLRRGEHNYRLLVQEATVGITITDPARQTLELNKIAKEIFGLAPDAPPETALPVLPEDSPDTLQRIIEGDVVHSERLIRRPDGSTIWVETSTKLLEDGRTQVILRDITDRKAAESAEREQRLLAEALRDTAAMVNSTLDLETVLDRVLEMVSRVVPHDSANIMRLKENHAILVREKHHGEIRQYNQELDISNLPDLQHVVNTRTPFIIEDTRTYIHWSGLPEVDWIRSAIAAPLRVGGSVIGFLMVDSTRPYAFTERDAQHVLAFADQAAIAIHNADLFAELESRVQQRTRELEDERARLRSILDALGEGVIFFDEDFKTHYTNGMLSRLTGYDEEDWRSVPAFELLRASTDTPNDILNRLLQVYACYERDGIWHGDIKLMRKDQTSFDASLTSTRVLNANRQQIGSVMIVRDVSREKELDKRKSHFVTRASHELRTPIANLKTRLYLIQRQPERRKEHLKVIDEVTNRMAALIEDLLDISRFENARVKFSPRAITLQSILMDVIKIQDLEAEERHITLNYTLPREPLQIYADAAQLQRAVSHLLTNALHYTPPGGTIEVTLRVQKDSQTGAHTAVLQVRDNGIGISPEFLPHIFDPFFRVDETNVKGSGLGLSITREIVQLHGGTISVESDYGKGTCFTITLQLLTPDKAEVNQRSAQR